MRVALPVPVERGGLPMMVDAGLLDRLVKEFDHRADMAGTGKNLPVANGPRDVGGHLAIPTRVAGAREQDIAHPPARPLPRPPRHHRLPRPPTCAPPTPTGIRRRQDPPGNPP